MIVSINSGKKWIKTKLVRTFWTFSDIHPSDIYYNTKVVVSSEFKIFSTNNFEIDILLFKIESYKMILHL